MADQTIHEELIFDGDPTGAQSALRTVSSEMGNVEKKASSVGSSVQGFGSRVLSFLKGIGDNIAKVGGIAAGAGTLAAKGLSGVGIAGGAVAGVLSGIGAGAGLAAAGIGVVAQKLLGLASASDQARDLGKTWDEVKAKLAAPFVHTLAQAFVILNNTLRDPAVQQVIQWFAMLASLILRSVLPAIAALAGAFTAFAHAIAEGDWAHIFQRTWDGFVDGWKSAGKAGGEAAGASFNQAWAEEQAKLAKSSSGPLRGGFLKDIGDLGTAALNALLSGFKKPDLDVLNQAADAIRARLDTLFKKGDIAEITIVPRLVVAQTAVAQALKEASDAGGVSDEIIARLRDKLASLGPDVQDYVEQLLRARDATDQVAKATQAVTDAQQKANDAAADLAKKQADLSAAESDLADMQTRHAADAQALSDQIFDAETKLADLQADQADKLAALADLRKKVADAAEEQYQAELKVQQAEDDLIPLQEKLKEAEEARSKLAAQISEAQRKRNEAIQDAQDQLDVAISAQEKLLDAVDAKYAGQLAAQKAIIDAVDAKWKKDIDGATEALKLTQQRFELEDSRNKTALIDFAKQRAAANLINDPNQRIAALARINRAEQQYNDRNKDRLEAAKLENDLAKENLDLKEGQRDAEKQSAVDEDRPP